MLGASPIKIVCAKRRSDVICFQSIVVHLERWLLASPLLIANIFTVENEVAYI